MSIRRWIPLAMRASWCGQEASARMHTTTSRPLLLHSNYASPHHRSGFQRCSASSQCSRQFSGKSTSENTSTNESTEAFPVPKGKIFYMCAAAAAAYLGYFILPLVGNGTAMHAVRLAQISNDPMMQRSAADRVALLAINQQATAKLVEVGAVAAMLRLVATRHPEDEGVVKSATSALIALAQCKSGKTELGSAEARAILNSAVAASSDQSTKERLTSLLEAV